MTRRAAIVTAAAAGAAVLATALGGAAAATAPPAESTLASIVASWPSAYTVTGTKAEPLYTERIGVVRAGDRFALRIEAIGQGDAAMGVQESSVHVTAEGAVTWDSGCGKDAASCEDDPALRGFLATAALIGLARTDRLPATAESRELHGTAVLCVDDAELYPDAPPAIVRLDPCFDRSTGAVLGHWSPGSQAFVGATLAAGFRVAVDDPHP